jgi:hypothetical protein
MRIGVAAFAAYVASILGANWLVQHYGVVSVGFGLTATAGTFAAGARCSCVTWCRTP